MNQRELHITRTIKDQSDIDYRTGVPNYLFLQKEETLKQLMFVSPKSLEVFCYRIGRLQLLSDYLALKLRTDPGDFGLKDMDDNSIRTLMLTMHVSNPVNDDLDIRQAFSSYAGHLVELIKDVNRELNLYKFGPNPYIHIGREVLGDEEITPRITISLLIQE